METDALEGLEHRQPSSAEKDTFIVAPLVHDIGTNCTQLAEKRNGPVPMDCAALSHHIKRFTDFTFPSLGMDCSLFPTLQDVLANFTLPPSNMNEAPTQNNPLVRKENKLTECGTRISVLNL